MTLLAVEEALLVTVVAVVMFLLFLVILVVFATAFLPWMQAYLAGKPIPLISIIGMRLRRVPVKTVVRLLIMAQQAGVDVACEQMERAYLRGVDVEKVTLAMIHAHREGTDVTFEQLVEADLEDRLAEKLEDPRRIR